MSFDISNLKPGDPVAYRHYRTSWDHKALILQSTVDRFTPTQIVLADGTRFRRDDGRAVGGRYGEYLVDPDGSEATQQRMREEYWRLRHAVEELLRGRECSTAEALTQWHDRIAAVLLDSRVRLREIAGGA